MTEKLFILDIACIALFSVHLTDIDTTLKILASILIMATNIYSLTTKKQKNKNHEK